MRSTSVAQNEWEGRKAVRASPYHDHDERGRLLRFVVSHLIERGRHTTRRRRLPIDQKIAAGSEL